MGPAWHRIILFAQEGAGDPVAPLAGGPGAWFFVPIVLTIVVFYFMILLPERRRNRQKEELLKNVKKNDKVVTIGGLHGVVSFAKPDEDHVVLRIDEDKDVKVKINRSSIASVLTSNPEDSKAK